MLVLCGVVGEEPTYGDLVHYLAYDEALAAIRTINVFRYITVHYGLRIQITTESFFPQFFTWCNTSM